MRREHSWWIPAIIAASLEGFLAGPVLGESSVAFSDPAAPGARMPADWVDQPVRHRKPEADIVVALDQQMYPALMPFINDFQRNQGVRVQVINGTCGISSGMLARKEVDIGGFCCPPGQVDRYPGILFHTLGISAVALIVHKDNPVDDISLQQARALFRGNLDHWSDLPGIEENFSRPVQPIARLHCKLRPGHWRLLLAHEDDFSPRLNEVGAIPDMISEVTNNVMGVGYETLWMLQRYRERGVVKAISIESVRPSDMQALAEGRYPLYRTYNLTTWSDGPAAGKLAHRLVKYLLTRADRVDPAIKLVPHQRLREANWKFHGNELTGSPD